MPPDLPSRPVPPGPGLPRPGLADVTQAVLGAALAVAGVLLAIGGLLLLSSPT